jgi:hypothetical protein
MKLFIASLAQPRGGGTNSTQREPDSWLSACLRMRPHAFFARAPLFRLISKALSGLSMTASIFPPFSSA